MLKTEFEKRQKRPRTRPADDAAENYHERAKQPLSSRWKKHIQYRTTRASPASSSSQHVDKYRHSRRLQGERKEWRLKSWSGSKRKDKAASSRHRQDEIRGRRGVESSTVNNSGNSTSSEDEQELTQASLHLLHPFQDVTVKAKDYEPAAKYQRFNPFAEREETIKHEITQPPKAAGVQVVYTRNAVEAERWLRKHIVDCSTKAVGFDTEQKPQFVSKKHGGTENETAVLQLGVETSCLVLHIYHMSEMPKSLKSILRDENILKIGSGIDKDASKFTRESGLICQGLVDTQPMATSLGLQKIGLKALAERFLGMELDKGVALTNWENFPLHLRQIEYAALDAWVGLKVYQEMKRQKKSSKDIKASPNFGQGLLARIMSMKSRRKRK